MRVRVVGAGVIGLSCAVRLREAGADVEVVAERRGPGTTSAVAAAMWYPYHVGPLDQVRTWGRATLAELTALAGDPATGVTVRQGVQRLRTAAEYPGWACDVPGFRVLAEPSSRYVGAWSFAAPVADTSVYLAWLGGRLAELGGVVREERVASEEEALSGVDVAVLATGVGAGALPGDATVTGGHGQVVRVRAPRVRTWTLDPEHPEGMVYVVPRRDDVVCGGIDVERPASEPPGEPDPAVAAAILRRCAAVVPELAGAQVLGHAVGVRPLRPSVRLERIGDIVHCYGHGGAGFTLSWGCADRVRDLVLPSRDDRTSSLHPAHESSR
ncbi:MAG TPA: FAD-dependent oxidoreductase [Pseudonocardiaceae bacterium]